MRDKPRPSGRGRIARAAQLHLYFLTCKFDFTFHAVYNNSVKRLQAFKFELMPNGEQARDMSRFAGACRFVYNKALALQKDNHAQGGKYINYVAMAKHLTSWRQGQDEPWLKEAPIHPLQHALKDLDKAYQNFFGKRAAFPRFKRKGMCESFRYPDAKQIKLDA
jgi:putative transposase